MIKSLLKIILLIVVVVASEQASPAQDCATVNMAESTASSTSVTAQLSVLNCRLTVGENGDKHDL